MQKLILLALIGFVFMGCSSGNNDNKGATGGGVSQFAQKQRANGFQIALKVKMEITKKI